MLGDQKTVAVVLAVTAAALLVAGGLGLWAHAGWWRSVAAIGLAASFGLMIVYFNPWYLFIEGVNTALIVGIVWLRWPSKTMVGGVNGIAASSIGPAPTTATVSPVIDLSHPYIDLRPRPAWLGSCQRTWDASRVPLGVDRRVPRRTKSA